VVNKKVGFSKSGIGAIGGVREFGSSVVCSI
jgi:hypothetical protein